MKLLWRVSVKDRVVGMLSVIVSRPCVKIHVAYMKIVVGILWL